MRVLLVIVVILSVVNLLGLAVVAGRMARLGPPGPIGPEGLVDPMPPSAGGAEVDGQGRPGGRHGEWPGPEHWREVRRVVEKYFPELQESMQGPGAGRRMGPHLRRHWRAISELVEADRTDPELAGRLADSYRKERELDRLRWDYDHATGDDRQAVRQEMRKLLEEQFELRQWIRQRKLEELARQIDQFRRELAERAERREDLIARELDRRLEAPGQEQLPEW
ncbi:MAG: hypothetical protein GXY33_20855 [Phycisphaerae bacterium]|nr:hypothetical protein [Phycisphaerae bacterium]